MKGRLAQAQGSPPPIELQLARPAQAEFVICDYTIETTFENMKRDLHLDEFMVREWVAIERLLWAGAMAYTLLVVLRLQAHEESRRFLEEVLRLLREQAVMGQDLTVGKLREAIALDYTHHPAQWLAVLQEAT